MTAYAFMPSVTAPFQFQPTLDGAQYVASIRWNMAWQRWYLFVDQVNGVNVCTLGLSGSPVGAKIAGAIFDEASLTASITTATPHGYGIGKTIELSVRGMQPEAWNGSLLCFVTGPDSISYSLANNPGAATQLGTVSFDINLVAGYFQESSLVWRPGAAQIEVYP